MKTGFTVIAALVASAWLAIYFVGSRSERRDAARDARREFRTAVYVSRGARDAELAYIEACRACAPAAECERDRLVIASGRSSDSYNPCE